MSRNMNNVPPPQKQAEMAAAGDVGKPDSVHTPAAAQIESCAAVLHQLMRRFHSDVGSPLAAIGLRIEILRNGGACDEKTKSALEEIGNELGNVIVIVRDSVRDLRKLEEQAASLRK